MNKYKTRVPAKSQKDSHNTRKRKSLARENQHNLTRNTLALLRARWGDGEPATITLVNLWETVLRERAGAGNSVWGGRKHACRMMYVEWNSSRSKTAFQMSHTLFAQAGHAREHPSMPWLGWALPPPPPEQTAGWDVRWMYKWKHKSPLWKFKTSLTVASTSPGRLYIGRWIWKFAFSFSFESECFINGGRAQVKRVPAKRLKLLCGEPLKSFWIIPEFYGSQLS